VRVYDRGLTWVLRHEAFTLGILLITIAVNIYLFVMCRKVFSRWATPAVCGAASVRRRTLPFRRCRTLPPGSPISSNRIPAVATNVVFTGGNTPINTGQIIVTLKPYEQRGLSASEVIHRLRPKVNSVPGARAVMYAVQNLKNWREDIQRTISIHAPLR